MFRGCLVTSRYLFERVRPSTASDPCERNTNDIRACMESLIRRTDVTKGSKYAALRTALMEWFDATQRPLPWRGARHPYQTWISEVMLQQTRVDQVIPYLERFLSRFPDVRSLAEADIDAVLEVWEGLGYYARARNLHRASRIVAEAGFPTTSDTWRELPGVGEYTAAAVASILHDEPVAAIDGNVNRVISRVFAITDIYGSADFRRAVRGHVTQLLDASQPGDFNEAMMDLGATVCTPRAPSCTSCPLSWACEAYGREMSEAFPIRSPKKPTPLVHEVVVIAVRDGTDVLIRRRPTDGLLGGLWELPGVPRDENDPSAALSEHVLREAGVALCVHEQVASVRHAYSHFKVSIVAYGATLSNTRTPALPEHWRWLSLSESDAVGMPRAHRRLLSDYESTLQQGPSRQP